MTTDTKIVSYAGLQKKLVPLRKQKKKVVVVTGTFDLFHAGHLFFLEQAKRHGDVLVVGIGSDRVVRGLKGKERPILPEALRARLLAGLQVTDFVVIIDEDVIDQISGRKFFKLIVPDVWVAPARDRNTKMIATYARELGIRYVRVPRIKPSRVQFPLSTSYIIQKIRK